MRSHVPFFTVIFIEAIVVKIRDGQVANRPIYAAIGVTLDGEKDTLGLWAGTGGEGAKFWMSVLTDIKNRGVKDTFFLVCDGLKGLPEVVANLWPLTTVQTCIIHLIRHPLQASGPGPCKPYTRRGNRTNDPTPCERHSHEPQGETAWA
jgi:putative transposase